MEQAEKSLPIKVLVPKSRKRGISTIVQALNRFASKQIANSNALTVAHRAEDTQEIFSIAQRIHLNDVDQTQPKKPSRRQITFDNGSKYRCMTAMGNYVSSGSDTHWLHVSEAALLESKSGQDSENMQAIINAMPQGEGAEMTITVLESTGNGPKGHFPAMCNQAEAGKGDYKLVFISWLEDPDLTDPTFTGNMQSFEPPLTQYEMALVDEFNATPQQMAWRRKKIANDNPEWKLSDGNPPLFGYHFPARLGECFASVSGAIYPRFTRSRNCNKVVDIKGWDLYRAIDWGWQGDHAFVCLWVAHDPKAPPGLTFGPDIGDDVINEFIGYAADPKTGQPIKKDDHAPDALRCLVVTMKLTGRVHVYRGLYQLGAAHLGPSGMARKIHDMSGWRMPNGVNEAEIAAYAPGPDGESYLCCVADRSQGGMITQFSNWGIPTIPHGKPEAKDNSRGEVWDGIGEISILIAGDTLFYATDVDEERAALVNAYAAMGKGNLAQLTDEQAEVIRQDRGLSGNSTHDREESYMGSSN